MPPKKKLKSKVAKKSFHRRHSKVRMKKKKKASKASTNSREGNSNSELKVKHRAESAPKVSLSEKVIRTIVGTNASNSKLANRVASTPEDGPTVLIAPDEYVNIFNTAKNKAKQKAVMRFPTDVPTAMIATEDYQNLYTSKKTSSRMEPMSKKCIVQKIPSEAPTAMYPPDDDQNLYYYYPKKESPKTKVINEITKRVPSDFPTVMSVQRTPSEALKNQKDKDLPAKDDGRPQSPSINLPEFDLLVQAVPEQTSAKQQVPSLAMNDQLCKSSSRVIQSNLEKPELCKSEPNSKGITIDQDEPTSDDSDEADEELKANLEMRKVDAIEKKMELTTKDNEQKAEEQRRILITRIRNLEDELRKEQNKHAAAIGTVQKVEAEYLEMSKQLNQEKKSKKSIIGDHKKMKIKVKKCEQTVDELKASNDVLKTQMHDLTKRNSKLSSELDQVQQMFIQCETKRRATDSAREELAEKLSNLKQIEEKAQEKKKQNETMVKELNEKLEEAQANSEAATDSANKLRTQFEHASAELKREQEARVKSEISQQIIEQRNAELKSTLEQIQAAHRVKQREWWAQNEASFTELRQQLDSETKARLEANMETRKSVRQVKQLTVMLEEAKRVQQQDQNKLDRVDKRLQDYRNQLEELEEKYSRERCQRQKAERNLEDTIDESTGLEKELRKLKSQKASSVGGTAERNVSNANERAAKQTAADK